MQLMRWNKEFWDIGGNVSEIDGGRMEMSTQE